MSGRPKGRVDNPYNQRKQRYESDQQLNARIQKMAQTRKNNNAQKKANEAKRKEEDLKKKAEQAKARFFAPQHQLKKSSLPLQNKNTDAVVDAVIDEDITIDSEEINIAPARDVMFNLDIDEDEVKADDTVDTIDEDGCNSDGGGIQQEFIEAVQKRLRDEVSKNNRSTDLYLLNHLKKNGWWIRKAHVPWIVKKLGLKMSYLAYYRDVYVWLPDIRWTDVDCRPCCPTCKSNDEVGNHGFHANHFGRLVIGLRETYYVITRIYRCYSCMRKSKELSSSVDQLMDEVDGVSVEKMVDRVQYNFMGWDKRIMPLFPLGRGSEFPALLTWKAGVDKSVVAMMRPLFDKGFKPESFANMLKELHSSQFTTECLRHEYEIKGRRMINELGLASPVKEQPLGDFADSKKYNGVLPTGRYLEHVYIAEHNLIRHHLEREVKKRDGEVLIIDVSFKEPKTLYQYQGKQVFKGLVTIMTSKGEVRMQFHVYSDSHEQMLAALQAYEKTRMAMGFSGATHIITDNPRRDASFFANVMESVREQQAKYDTYQQASNGESTQGDEYYDPDHLCIKLAHGTEIDRSIAAMRAQMKGDVVGLDTEWNRILNSRGIQTGRGRIQWIQIAYRDNDDNVGVLLLWVGDLRELPNNLKSLLCDTDITFAGNKVSADLKYIGLDFNIAEIKAVDQKRRENVVNLGMFARVRNVVPSATVSLRQLCELTLGKTMDKSLQTSTWTKDLSDDQKKYAAVDAAVSLQVYESLSKLTDLSCRLTEKEANAGVVVDVVPSNGSPMSMASRSATGTIVGSSSYVCPVGYKIKGQRSVRVGKRMYVVRINKIHAPGLIVPRYQYKNSKAPITLADLGTIDILLPLDMLANHADSSRFLNIEIEAAPRNVTAPAPESTLNSSRRSQRGRIPKVHNAIDGYGDELIDGDKDVDIEWEELEEEIDDAMRDLTSEDIELLRAAVFEAKETEMGKAPLHCEGLDDAPSPETIQDKFSATLGDVFHAMDRAKIPIKHEAKKAYFVALRDAFLVWNPKKMAELEEMMRDSGMTDEEIQAQKYFNSRLFRDCVERKVPSPRILYWRVRAVYAMYGKMIDSKTQKPLFNPNAWKKANNVLKDILEGYYSDPPHLEFYHKRLDKNGEVKTNKYGLELIECFRGTNRVESYHKSLTSAFGKWSVGVEMSDCLLAERRHRHNHKCAELRRLGTPLLGHYNTWDIDQLQNLTKENHDIQLYPYWTNASDYIDTDESFDTVALHSASLHEKLEKKSKELGHVKLTREQQHLCKAMGTPLPFLPFAHKDEHIAYAKYILSRKDAGDYDKAAEDWLEYYVDGKNVWPKLSSQMRTYDETFSRNLRIKDSMRRARDGTQKLKELNAVVSPSATTDDGAELSWKEPAMPSPMLEPVVQAMHTAPFRIIGDTLVGKPPDVKVIKKTGRRCYVCKEVGCAGVGGRVHCPVMKRIVNDVGIGVSDMPKKKRRKRQCQLCFRYGPSSMNCSIGTSNKDRCKFFYGDGKRKE